MADKPARTMTTMTESDVIDLLVDQHARIKDLFIEVMTAPLGQRAEPFHRLVHLLAVHETAEEQVVHPLARSTIPGGDDVVEDRLQEEHEAKEMLSRLDAMDPDDTEFLPLLGELRTAVLEHARHEERYEFNWLRERCEPAQLRGAALAVKAAEAVAPTRPHPGVESAKANMAVGPIASVMDRVRDAIRNAKDDDSR